MWALRAQTSKAMVLQTTSRGQWHSSSTTQTKKKLFKNALGFITAVQWHGETFQKLIPGKQSKPEFRIQEQQTTQPTCSLLRSHLSGTFLDRIKN